MSAATILARMFFVLFFTLSAIPAGMAAICGLLCDDARYAMVILGALDRVNAAALGFAGDHTVSAECGSRQRDCQVCRFVRGFFAMLGKPTHCEDAAVAEGLIQRGA